MGNAFRKEIDSKFQQWKQNQLMPKKHAFQSPHPSPSQVLEAHSSWKLPSRLSSFRGGNTESQPQACYHFWFSLLLQSLWCFSIRPEKMKNRKLRWCTTSRAVLIVLGNLLSNFWLLEQFFAVLVTSNNFCLFCTIFGQNRGFEHIPIYGEYAYWC